MENLDIPILKPIWQEDGSLTTYLPGLAVIYTTAWRDSFGNNLLFDMEKAFKASIMEGQPPEIPDIDHEALDIMINHAFRQLLSLLREKNTALILEGRSQGCCLFCGMHPRIAFDTESAWTLFYHLYGHSWQFSRIRCTACNNADLTTLRYFKAEGLVGIRVSFCM